MHSSPAPVGRSRRGGRSVGLPVVGYVGILLRAVSTCLPLSLPPSSFGLKGICSTESTCASERAGSYGLKLDTGRKGASDGRGSFTACCIKSQATRYLPLPRSCCPSPTRAAAAATGSSSVRWPLGAATESAYLVWKGALPSLRTHSHTSGVPFAPTDRQFESGGMSSDTD